MDIETSPMYNDILRLALNVDELSESELLIQLRSLLQKNPNVVKERCGEGKTLFHYAAMIQTPAFIRVLVEMDPTLEHVKMVDEESLAVNGETIEGRLPFHRACFKYNIETAKYLFRLYPQSINMRSLDGCNALHDLFFGINWWEDNVTPPKLKELAEFLLEHNPGLASVPADDGSLPLHLFFEELHSLNWLQYTPTQFLSLLILLYDAYPEAIFMTNSEGHTPTDLACDHTIWGIDVQPSSELGYFLTKQVAFLAKSGHIRTPDENGQLPLHQALQDISVSTGTFKLLVSRNPESVRVADNLGQLPIHIACRSGRLDAVKYLVAQDEGSLQTQDNLGDLPLHVACRYGNYDVISWMLEADTGETEPNNNMKLPIEVLLYESDGDRNSLEFVQTVNAMLRKNPACVLSFIADKESS